jgi:hypothetical protein
MSTLNTNLTVTSKPLEHININSEVNTKEDPNFEESSISQKLTDQVYKIFKKI